MTRHGRRATAFPIVHKPDEVVVTFEVGPDHVRSVRIPNDVYQAAQRVARAVAMGLKHGD